MTDKELRRLSRGELLEMLLIQTEENEKLKLCLKKAQEALSDRRITVEHAGTMAEAALKLNGVFDAYGLAASLEQYVSDNGMTGKELKISGGAVVFSDLKPGLYLIVQNEAADGYKAAAPFLVSVPLYENGTYVYEVDASPKMSILTEEPAPEIPDEPSEPVTDRTLPQTGQLNWPVPALAMLGMCIFVAGWMLRQRESCR